MKARFILVAAVLALAASCQEKLKEYSPGQSLGEIVMTASEGSVSVSVDYDCLWRVHTPAEWISTDVDGRNGSAAFSFAVTSNESDATVSRQTRKAPIVLTRLDRYVSDTLWVIQRGIPDGNDYTTHITSDAIELRQQTLTEKSVLYCNLQGLEPEVAASWLLGRKEDIIAVIWNTADVASFTIEGSPVIRHENLMVIGNAEQVAASSLIVNSDGLNIQIADFTEDSSQNRYLQTVSLLDEGYNMPAASDMWLTGGSLYYLSSVEFGYESTPEWYPSSLKNKDFEADIYAWTNNLIDCIWMTSKTYNPTYTSSEGRTWRADYVYASKSAWNSITDVRILEDETLKHKPIFIKIKY